MFKIKQSSSYTWPVKFDVPIDGGTFRPETFDAEFRRIPQSGFKALLEALKPDAEACREVLIGWKGVIGEDGQEMQYSESARDNLLEVPLVAGAIISAFIDSYTGRAKVKNS